MTIEENKSTTKTSVSRRGFMTGIVGAASAATLFAQSRNPVDDPPSRYPDRNVIVLDKRFDKYVVGNASIERLYTGTRWAEGPAWSTMGRFLVWSDIPNNVKHRWIPDDGHVSVFQNPSNNSNGNTFDWQGRLICCENEGHRVVRFEHNGTMTVLADSAQGKPLNAPNDAVVHPADGGIWFTDPGYGSLYEGGDLELKQKEAVYRIDPKTGKVDKVTDVLAKPNGLCFSPDYKKLYIADTGEPGNILVFDVVGNEKLGGGKVFASMKMKLKGVDVAGAADGIRADADGNVWASAGWVGEGFDGVHVFAPDGTRIGQILLPEICANLCFGGAKRNRLFMTASKSLYSLYVGVKGAHVC